MWRIIFSVAISFWVFPSSLALAREPAHKELPTLHLVNASASHKTLKVAEDAHECAKHAEAASEWLQRAGISIDIGSAALVFEDGHASEAASRHANLWIRVAEQEEEVAKQSIQAAKLESSTEKFMGRLEKQQRDLFATKDKFLNRVKGIKLSQAEQAQQTTELKKAEKAMEGLKQWPGANKLRIPFEQRRLADLRRKRAETAATLAKNISDIQNGLKNTEDEVARWEGRKKVLQELGDKLDVTADTLRERKRELYRQDRMLEGLEILLDKGRDDSLMNGKSLQASQAPTAHAQERRNSVEKLLDKAHARLEAADTVVQGLLQKLKSSGQEAFYSFKPATMEAVKVLSDSNTEVEEGMKAIGRTSSDTEGVSVAKVAILDAQTGFVTALKRLEMCVSENSQPTRRSPIDINKEENARKHETAHQTLNKKQNARKHVTKSPSTSASKAKPATSSDSSDPAAMLRQKLHDFQKAAAEAQASPDTSKPELVNAVSTGERSARRLENHANDVPGDLQQKIRQLAKEVRAANSLISMTSEAH